MTLEPSFESTQSFEDESGNEWLPDEIRALLNAWRDHAPYSQYTETIRDRIAVLQMMIEDDKADGDLDEVERAYLSEVMQSQRQKLETSTRQTVDDYNAWFRDHPEAVIVNIDDELYQLGQVGADKSYEVLPIIGGQLRMDIKEVIIHQILDEDMYP